MPDKLLVVSKQILQLQKLILMWCAIHLTNFRTMRSIMPTLMWRICEPGTTGIACFPPDIAFSPMDTP